MAEKKKMHVKKGDTVIVITGKDAGKKGKIIDVDAAYGRVFVDKINLVSRHTKPTQAAPQGGIIKKEGAIDASNVMLVCSKCNKATRIAYKILPDGKKVRVCKKCDAQID